MPESFDRITPPWSAGVVDRLNEWQTSAWVHPFTCPHRDIGHVTRSNEDLGQLLATSDGFICLDCTYSQEWAYYVMSYGAPSDPFRFGKV